MPPTYHKVVDANEMLHKAPILKGCRCFAKTHSLPSPFCMGEGEGGWDPNQIFEKGGGGGGLLGQRGWPLSGRVDVFT